MLMFRFRFRLMFMFEMKMLLTIYLWGDATSSICITDSLWLVPLEGCFAARGTAKGDGLSLSPSLCCGLIWILTFSVFESWLCMWEKPFIVCSYTDSLLTYWGPIMDSGAMLRTWCNSDGCSLWYPDTTITVGLCSLCLLLRFKCFSPNFPKGVEFLEVKKSVSECLRLLFFEEKAPEPRLW